MRTIHTSEIERCVCDLLIRANYTLPPSLQEALRASCEKETDPRAKTILTRLSENIDAARDLSVPVCQDTGMAVVFLEIGQEVALEGKLLRDAVNDGVRRAYDEGYLRKSVVKEPLFDRVNTQDNTPAVLYTEIVAGDRVRITVAPKGFGSENMSRSRMFTPSAAKDDILGFVVETVKIAGGNPCPPIVLGVGIGGTFEYSAYLAKKALCRDLCIRNSHPLYAALETELLEKINETGVGPQGFGGRTTALGVNIEWYPTHIAGLPVSVNVGCHVTRHAECVL